MQVDIWLHGQTGYAHSTARALTDAHVWVAVQGADEYSAIFSAPPTEGRGTIQDYESGAVVTEVSGVESLPARAPEKGELVSVRSRTWLVDDVKPPAIPGQSPLVSLSC